MVKGVNKTVIVVNDTGNEMFEKIVFYVTPKYSKGNLRESKQAAGEFSLTLGHGKGQKKITLRKRRLRKKVIISGLILLSIAVLTIAAVLIF